MAKPEPRGTATLQSLLRAPLVTGDLHQAPPPKVPPPNIATLRTGFHPPSQLLSSWPQGRGVPLPEQGF